MSWTDERIERLKELWSKGMTASQIADELGSVSRNAVIGKAHRLGLQSRPRREAERGRASRREAERRPPSAVETPPANRRRGGASRRRERRRGRKPRRAAAAAPPAPAAAGPLDRPRRLLRQGPGEQQAPIPPGPAAPARARPSRARRSPTRPACSI
jgi:GcrA cell cycle regulator